MSAIDPKEDCPQGEDCGIHYRISARVEEPEFAFLAYTDYVGEYCIITSMNPESYGREAIALALQGRADEIPAAYDTAILRVGQLALSDAAVKNYEDKVCDEEWTAWTQEYETFEHARDAHDMVVDAMKADLLELEA